MYIKDGVVYAENPSPMIKISGVRPLADHKLWLRFSTGEAKLFDFKPLLKSSVFAPLSDESMFRQVYIDYGVTVWCDGDIDIAPEKLYADSVAVNNDEIA